MGSELSRNDGGRDDGLDEATQVAEQGIARVLLEVLCDGSPLVRTELAIGMLYWQRNYVSIVTVMQNFVLGFTSVSLVLRTLTEISRRGWCAVSTLLWYFIHSQWINNDYCQISLFAALARLASSHNRMFRQAAAAYLKPPSHSTILPASGAGYRSPRAYPSSTLDVEHSIRSNGGTPYRSGLRVVSSNGSAGFWHITLLWTLSGFIYDSTIFDTPFSLNLFVH